MYDTLARPVVEEFLAGTNGCIMAYGQTGAGKTFTMMGDTAVYANRGVSPRCISHVFAEIEARHETVFLV